MITVGVGDCRLSNDPDCELVTYALGSCVAVTVFDPVIPMAGLLHFMLPESALSRERAWRNPFMFADTGIPLLFRRAYELGSDRARIIVRIAGGAHVLDERGQFNIGLRNCIAARRILSEGGVVIHGQSLGGCESRTLRLEVATGRLHIHASSCSGPEAAVKGLRHHI